MSGILSVRVDFDERQRLMLLAAAEGHKNVSELIRNRLSLPSRGERADPVIEQYGDLNVMSLLEHVAMLAEQQLRLRRMVDKIARRLSVAHDVDDEWRDLPRGEVIDDECPPMGNLAALRPQLPAGFTRK